VVFFELDLLGSAGLRELHRGAVYSADAGSLACRQDDGGPADEFHDVISQLAAGTPSADGPAVRFREIAVRRISGAIVGYAETQISDDAAGGESLLEVDAWISLRSKLEWSFLDSRTVSTVDPYGRVSSILERVKSADVVNRNRRVVRTGPSEYRVEETVQGHPVQETLRTREPLTHPLATASRAKLLALKGHPDDVLTLLAYYAHPQFDSIEAQFRMNADGSITRQIGPLTYRLSLDSAGIPTRVQIPAQELVRERIWSEGVPPRCPGDDGAPGRAQRRLGHPAPGGEVLLRASATRSRPTATAPASPSDARAHR
jgi:hypothetical protein